MLMEALAEALELDENHSKHVVADLKTMECIMFVCPSLREDASLRLSNTSCAVADLLKVDAVSHDLDNQPCSR